MLVILFVVYCIAEVSSKRVSFEPVDAQGAAITGLLVALVVSLVVGIIAILDVLTLLREKPWQPRSRRRVS